MGPSSGHASDPVPSHEHAGINYCSDTIHTCSGQAQADQGYCVTNPMLFRNVSGNGMAFGTH